eukprot:jgi/Phyca11/14204/fgenesh1_pg.PHYCAscaffold_6_\
MDVDAIATVIEAEDETTGSCFERALLALDPTGVWNNQSVLGIDSVEMEHTSYNGTMLVLDMRDTLDVTLEEEDEALVWQAQRAEAESEYLASVAQLSRQNEPAGQYIRGLQPEKWCLYPYLAVRKMYGWQTTRFEEIDLVLSLVAMHAAFQRHERATQWESERRVVTPEAERLMQEQLTRVQLYSVCMSSAQLAFVWNSQKPQIRQRRVDLEHRTCTCSRRLQWGIPCRHVLAALQKLGAMDRAVEFFDECYLVRNYVSSFKDRALELPVDGSFELDTTLRPPRYVNKQNSNNADSNVNSKQKKRRKRNLPLDQRKRPMYKCHKCNRAEGHNKGTCPY